MCCDLNTLVMLVYLVSWVYSHDLAKGKGKITKNEISVMFSVLCRNSKDALKCLEWVFTHDFKNQHNLTLDDGEITLKRSIVDSRNIMASYLLMDGMTIPLELYDLKGSLTRYTKNAFLL